MGCSASSVGGLHSLIIQRKVRVSVQKGLGDVLGLKLLVCGDDRIAVVKVEEGIIQEWNDGHPRDQVEPGDRIESVNGLRGTAARLLRELQQTGPLEVVLTRGTAPEGAASLPVEEIHATVTRYPGQPLGLSLQSSALGGLRIGGIDEGAIQDWNRDHPTQSLCIGDRLSAVGDAHTTGEMLRLLQEAEGPVLLSVVRGPRAFHGPMELMMYRDLTPADYERLMLLDEGEHLPAEVVPQGFVESLPRGPAHVCGCAGKASGSCSCVMPVCGICLDGLEDPKVPSVLLPCGHVFHMQCAKRWLSECKSRCPLCSRCVLKGCSEGAAPSAAPPEEDGGAELLEREEQAETLPQPVPRSASPASPGVGMARMLPASQGL